MVNENNENNETEQNKNNETEMGADKTIAETKFKLETVSQKQKTSIVDKLKPIVAVGVLLGAGFGGGYLTHQVMADSPYQVKEQNGSYVMVAGGESLAINHNDKITVGDLEYSISAVKENITANDSATVYWNQLAQDGLTNAEVYSNETKDLLAEKSGNLALSNSEFQQKLTPYFVQLGEKNPELFDNMGSEFKGYATSNITKEFVSQMKKDGRNFWDDLWGNKPDTLGTKVQETTTVDKLKAGYEMLRKQLTGGN